MIYPQYSNEKTCGGSYSLHGNVCHWAVTREGGHVAARIYGDYRHEGKAYIFPTRREALVALSDLIFEEVA